MISGKMLHHQAEAVAKKLVSQKVFTAKDVLRLKDVTIGHRYIEELIDIVIIKKGAFAFLQALKETNQAKLAKHLEDEAVESQKNQSIVPVSEVKSETKGILFLNIV